MLFAINVRMIIPIRTDDAITGIITAVTKNIEETM
jgi:hypothetical protein